MFRYAQDFTYFRAYRDYTTTKPEKEKRLSRGSPPLPRNRCLTWFIPATFATGKSHLIHVRLPSVRVQLALRPVLLNIFSRERDAIGLELACVIQ